MYALSLMVRNFHQQFLKSIVCCDLIARLMDPPAPLMKAERTKCYEARDKYFQCLNDTIDDRQKCAHLQQPMKDLCPEKWVSPANLRRSEHRNTQLLTSWLQNSFVLQIKSFEQRRKFLRYKDAVARNEIDANTGATNRQ